jgi:hypothetical protein
LRVSLGAWDAIFRVPEQSGQRNLLRLAKRAESRHDPEGLVFVAARLTDAWQSARLADEAVRLDPSFLWAYAVVAGRYPDLPQVQKWLPALEHWDPQNALFPYIRAESIEINYAVNASKLSSNEWKKGWHADAAWRSAMAAAFASPKFHDYIDRMEKVDHDVVCRYRLSNPEQLLSGEVIGWLAFADAEEYAKSLVQSGENLEATGHEKEASEKFWAVADFGQMIDSQGHADSQRFLGNALQNMAYKHLQVFSETQGNSRGAALFAYLATKFDPHRAERQRERAWVFGSYIARRNAAVLQISSVVMLISCAALIIAASVLIAGYVRAHTLRRSQPAMTVLALISAVGVLLSSATLYLTYRPYWYIFERAILQGETSQTEDLRSFLAATRGLPGLGLRSELPLRLPVYFWTAVILIAVAGLILILLRYTRPRTRLNQPRPHARVP